MTATKGLPGVSTFCNVCHKGFPADLAVAEVLFRTYEEAPRLKASILIRFTKGCPLCQINGEKDESGMTHFPISIEEKQ